MMRSEQQEPSKTHVMFPSLRALCSKYGYLGECCRMAGVRLRAAFGADLKAILSKQESKSGWNHWKVSC